MSSVVTKPLSLLPAGTSFARLVAALGKSGGDSLRARFLAEAWRDSPEVLATLEAWHHKAAVPSGSTTDASWAGPLAPFGVAREALTILRGLSVVGTLEPRMRRVPLHVHVPVETGGGITGGWVAAGNAIPVQQSAFTTAIQEHYKYGVIVSLSRELLKLSTPDAEATITRTLLGGLAAAIDLQFLSPTVALSAGVNPASVTNGSSAVVSSGSTAAAIATDLAALLAAVTSPGPLTWIMKPKTMYYVSLTLGAQAAGLPSTLFGVPVIASNNSPAQITLLDPAAILYSDSGAFDVDVSEEATVQLNDAPDNPTTASTVFATAFGNNYFFVRALRWLAWQRALAGSVAYMTVSY